MDTNFVNGDLVNGDLVNGDLVNGDLVNGDLVNGDLVNGDLVNGDPGNGEFVNEVFVSRGSIVRKIWGRSDTVLFVFAGSAAEFALNRSVDWLYYTGRLPADPIGRLFSTVRYARVIIFSPADRALGAIDQITAIHSGVEKSRGMKIPDSAYRDVLFMLIDYSIRSFELLERKLMTGERAEIFDVFLRVGVRMGLKGLPETYEAWELMREEHLERDLVYSELTKDLYRRYKKSLGTIRYRILLGGQALLAPERVKRLLSLRGGWWMRGVVLIYKMVRFIKLDSMVKMIVLPPAYRAQVAALDVGTPDVGTPDVGAR